MHDPKQLLVAMKRSGGSNRFPELLGKIRELESHSRGGKYEHLLSSMRKSMEEAQNQCKGINETESQCGLFGENFILKPFVHFLTCWDAVDRKKLQKQCDWAVAQRDKFYRDSLSLVSSGQIAQARDAEAKVLEMGATALKKNREQRDALKKLERAACMDLEAYSTDASAFLQKWENSYNARLESVQDDIGTITDAIKSTETRHASVEQSFKTQLHEHAKRLADNASRRAANMRALRDILQSEIDRERELKEEELALTTLQHEVEQWKRVKEISKTSLANREKELMDSEDVLMNSISVVTLMRGAENELNGLLDSELGGRHNAIASESKRLASQHYELSSELLKALTRKGDRLRRRAEILEQKRADCFFTVEMAYENETPIEEVREAQQSAQRLKKDSDTVRKQLEDLTLMAKTVDNEDLRATLNLLSKEHPQREIREALQHERRAYNEKVQGHLKDEIIQLGDKSVHYVTQTPRELDEVVDHKFSDSIADQAKHPAVFSPPMKSRNLE